MLEKEYIIYIKTIHIYKKNVTLEKSVFRVIHFRKASFWKKNPCSQTCRFPARGGARMPVTINTRPSVLRPVGRSAVHSCLAKCLVRVRCIGQKSCRSPAVIKDNSWHEVSRLPWYTWRPVAFARKPRVWWRDEGIDRRRSETASHSRCQNHKHWILGNTCCGKLWSSGGLSPGVMALCSRSWSYPNPTFPWAVTLVILCRAFWQ